MLCHYAECFYAEYRLLFNILRSLVMVSVIMLNLIMLSVVMLNVIMLIVVTPNVVALPNSDIAI